MKKIFLSSFFLFLITIVFAFSPKSAHAATVGVGETCGLRNICDSKTTCVDPGEGKPATCVLNGSVGPNGRCDNLNFHGSGDITSRSKACQKGYICTSEGKGNVINRCKPSSVLGLPPPPPCATAIKDGKCTSFQTGIGKINTNPGDFVRTIFGVLLALSGGVALLLIMRAGYKMMNSRGKPETIQEARDQLIAAIVGLAFLIFSFVFLEVIGVDILRIPGLSSTGATQSNEVKGTCNSCETANSCSARGGKVTGTFSCKNGTVCCE